ncbi:tRNA-uridine aminocarboxypropyltransferase [Colwellia sp. E2M01]|uniref:tRNA-uridine aminocarboxypropyltransferase n=1 Tax=Colwellia sp. E2M01 TaxID=2841561 RepID=UPI001C0A3A51|nr:tRNA-uridine aminocarboxypropyltransferase [Colwellia sp. E2M01]MBU2870887.1 DTW domain-containing protein [Colwellia sp. E2M01]
MSRKLCDTCQRPDKACICQFTIPIANKTHVVVLQHPSEVSQVKGTIALLAKSLSSCQIIIGEDFSDDRALQQIIEQYDTLLLYPSEQAQIIDASLINLLKEKTKKPAAKPPCLLILDGTWKKAYRMFMLSSNLQQLPQVCLPEEIANAGQYLIRKVAKKNALSSLEAACYALALLESPFNITEKSVKPNQVGKYQPLLDKFAEFNQFQLSFRPK